jgi:hypothetical protein
MPAPLFSAVDVGKRSALINRSKSLRKYSRIFAIKIEPYIEPGTESFRTRAPTLRETSAGTGDYNSLCAF